MARRPAKIEGGAICAFCKVPLDQTEMARTFETPPGHSPLPAGSGWVICGKNCPKLPKGAEVFYRKLGYAWSKR